MQILKATKGIYCKVRLWGNKTTPEETRKFFVDKVTNGIKIAHLAKEHNITTKTIYRYLKWAEELGEVTKVGNKWVLNQSKMEDLKNKKCRTAAEQIKF